MKVYVQEDKNQCNNLTSLEFCYEFSLKNPVDELDGPYNNILNLLSGSGDSVFNILRPLTAVKLNYIDSGSEVESLRNPDSNSNQSTLSGDESEYERDDINNRSAEILSTSTSETSSSLENTEERKSVIMDENEIKQQDADEPLIDKTPQAESNLLENEKVEPLKSPQSNEEKEKSTPEKPNEEPKNAYVEETDPVGKERKKEAEEQNNIERSSIISSIPVTDSVVLVELQETDKRAINIAKLVDNMRKSITAYMEKDELSEEDKKNYERIQNELMEKLQEFEEITDKVKQLIGIASSTSLPPTTTLDTQKQTSVKLQQLEKQTSVKPQELGIITERVSTDAPGREFVELTEFLSPEEKLPKVVVCGMQDQVPRIIVCEGSKKKKAGRSAKSACKNNCPNLMSLSGRLTESYCLQEKLASENADLEGARYTLEEALLCKDNTVDHLQKKVGTLQTEMRIVLKENSMLSEKLTQLSKYSAYPGSCRPQNIPVNYACSSPTMPQALGPGDSGGRIKQQYDNTCQLECQLNQIESEVKVMQSELGQLQRERQQLEQQRKMIKALNTCPPPQTNSPRESSCNIQLRELREQYNRLQDDFKNKVIEVASLRNENIQLRQTADSAKGAQAAAEATAQSLEEKYKHNEVQNRMLMGSKEKMVEQEQQLNVAKQRFREAADELEELRSVLEDQSSQLEDYKKKYLQAQEQVEEQKRKIELLELDNTRISEEVNLELQRIKSQFQEQLQELTPLPDLLTATQMKFKESQQLKAVAENNLQEVTQALQEAKEKIASLQKELSDNRNSMQFGSDERAAMKAALENWEKKYNEIKEENTIMKANLARLEEASTQNQIRLQEKLHEINQLAVQLETVREESARQVSRTKDRSETMRRSLQNKIFELEKELVQSRAASKSAQKDRDDIRHRMQTQINNLTDNFGQAQLRIRSLQSHVNFLKTSYTDLCPSEKGNLMITENVPAYGTDTCDCNF